MLLINIQKQGITNIPLREYFEEILRIGTRERHSLRRISTRGITL